MPLFVLAMAAMPASVTLRHRLGTHNTPGENGTNLSNDVHLKYNNGRVQPVLTVTSQM